MDHIYLNGVECQVKLGVPDWERKKRQKVLVDVSLGLDLSQAGRNDDMNATVDYWAIEKCVREVAEVGEFRLAEHLAETLAHAALAGDPRLYSVNISVHKKPAVMPKTREVVIEVFRFRGKNPPPRKEMNRSVPVRRKR